MKKQLLFLMVLMLSLTADAAVLIDGICYNFDTEAKTAEVTNGVYYTGSVLIPESITFKGTDYSVTSIGEKAFYNCKSLSSVTIPKSMTSIGWAAFRDCTSLTSVHLTDLAAWCNISFGYGESNPLYYAGHLYLNNEEITNLIIPNNITSISSKAFYGCIGLTSITIHKNITTIDSRAFEYCSNLNAVYIADLTAWCNISFSDE